MLIFTPKKRHPATPSKKKRSWVWSLDRLWGNVGLGQLYWAAAFKAFAVTGLGVVDTVAAFDGLTGGFAEFYCFELFHLNSVLNRNKWF